MGIFTQKAEEPGEWAALPAEPFDRDEADLLPESPATDPLGPNGFGLGLGGPGDVASAASIEIPVRPGDPEDAPAQ